jgi:hypothetical protein
MTKRSSQKEDVLACRVSGFTDEKDARFSETGKDCKSCLLTLASLSQAQILELSVVPRAGFELTISEDISNPLNFSLFSLDKSRAIYESHVESIMVLQRVRYSSVSIR